jgi:hypothetical protein
MDPRETLIRETFALYREIGYATFRAEFFADPEAMRHWPDAAEREQQLRAEWRALSEEHFERYRQEKAHASLPQLMAERDLLKGMLVGPLEGDRPLIDRVHAAASDQSFAHNQERPQGRGH